MMGVGEIYLMDQLDRAKAVMDTVLEGLSNYPQKILNYNFHRGDQTNDIYIKSIMNAPRNQDNFALFYFNNSFGAGNTQTISNDGTLEYHDTTHQLGLEIQMVVLEKNLWSR